MQVRVAFALAALLITDPAYGRECSPPSIVVVAVSFAPASLCRRFYATVVAILERAEVVAKNVPEGLELLLRHLSLPLEHDPRHGLRTGRCRERPLVGVVRSRVRKGISEVDRIALNRRRHRILRETGVDQLLQEGVRSSDLVDHPDHGDFGRVDEVVLKNCVEFHHPVLSTQRVLR